MGSGAHYFLPTRESFEPRVPREVRRRTETRFPRRATRLPRVPRSSRFERGLRSIPAHIVTRELNWRTKPNAFFKSTVVRVLHSNCESSYLFLRGRHDQLLKSLSACA